MQLGAPAHERARVRLARRTRRPARARAATCAAAMRGCGGISNARSSTSPWRPVRRRGSNSLSIEISARCVLPATSTSRWRNSASTSHGGGRALGAASARASASSSSYERVVARLVDARRLRGRADEQPGEQVRQRRVVLHERDQAREQVGPLQERAVERRRPAERDVVAAARAGEPAVEHVLLGGAARPRARRRRRSRSSAASSRTARRPAAG